MPKIENIVASDLPQILKLNQSEVPHVGEITFSELEKLIQKSIYAKKITVDSFLAGFLIGFDDKSDYQSLNYQWFKSKDSNFFYVDRIAIFSEFQGKGLGSLLYKDVVDYSRLHKITSLTCEVNLLPPNPKSLAYHKAQGFEPVGEMTTSGGTKKVCFLRRTFIN